MISQTLASISVENTTMDRSLIAAAALLLSVGMVMVASSSMDFAFATYGDPWFFVKKQCLFLCVGILGGAIIASVPTDIWQKYAGVLLLVGLVLLLAVLVPGIGKVVNGSRRWLDLGPVGIQASELAKFCFIIYFASYLARKNEEVKARWAGFFKMVMVLGLAAILLLAEPDFGSAVVLSMTLSCMMFVAGIPVFRFAIIALFGLASMFSLAYLSPYRWERIVAFMDPWSRQFDSGYQLVQSLIAFGRGEWFGAGLGNSLQKLFFLPEAHTDFIFAIYAEEFGFVGAILLVVLYGFFVWRMIALARIALSRQKLFSGFLVFGIAGMFAMQAFINMGVASGLLPTKGLTLPLISYGGSSLLICCLLIALVFRVSWEESEIE
ncbi:putative lipid II flippase FtsW [Teredinibacter turnerae]|uniref:putative lipid II flippase FtsW n=1 Tax=Teredinibacter turnerae TaxID=2426 RepID=UPI000374C04C|nr:putative lipid II flippase FtsW [Teredinibacter turnerae]